MSSCEISSLLDRNLALGCQPSIIKEKTEEEEEEEENM